MAEKLTVLAAVAASVAALAPAVEQDVIDTLVLREREKRSALIVRGFDELRSQENAFKKFKPDVVTYNGDGTVSSEQWSKAKLDERNKAQEKLNKLITAIEKALEGDTQKLTEALNNTKPAADAE